MNSIPLVRNNSVNDINTSLIALQKVLRELTETTSDVNKETVTDAETAEKLETARNLKVNLASSNAQSFDGSADAENIGVDGTLPVANGGTGQTDLADVNVGSATTATRLGPIGIDNIRIGSAQAKITLEQLMTWFITTKAYIPSGVSCFKTFRVPWSYANNDILQLSIDGNNYELQLAGCIIEFFGNATNYNSGIFRLRIHSSPALSFTATSGYSKFPVNHIAEYTCNGSDYSPAWKMILEQGDSARAISGAVTCSTAAGTAAKTVTLPGFRLTRGARLSITLSNANTVASALTLNVNETGAKTIRWNGTVTSSSTYAMTATTYTCYYDGTYWNMDSSFESYSARVANGPNGIGSAPNYGAVAYCSTAAATVAKTASCYGYKLIIGQYVKLYIGTTSTASSPTLNIASTGAKSIFVNGVAASTTNLTAGWYEAFYDGNYYQLYSATTSVLPSSGCAVCHTAAGTAAKVASMPYFKLQSGTTFELVIVNANSSASALTLNINGTGAKTLYINNTVSSASNYTLPAGTYLCRYNDSYYYIDTGYFVSTARNANYANSARSANNGVPVGTIIAYYGSTAPSGWLICDGSSKAKATYPALATLITGSSSTTGNFTLPDLRESVLVGVGTRGSGVTTHDTYTLGQFKDDQMQKITGSVKGDSEGLFNARGNITTTGVFGVSGSTSWAGGDNNEGGRPTTLSIDTSADSTLRTGDTTRTKQFGINYLIKY